MCDKGILEYRPDSMKLEYVIEITAEVQKKIEDGISKLIGEPVWISNPKSGQYPTERPDYDRNTITVKRKRESPFRQEVVSFSLKELPGCCGVLVSYNVRVCRELRNKGINSFLQGIRQEIAKHNGYTMLLCTTTSENHQEIHILKKYGWKRAKNFVNARTGNKVLIFTKTIK